MIAGAGVKRTLQNDSENKRLKSICHDHQYSWTSSNINFDDARTLDKSVQTGSSELRTILHAYLLGDDTMMRDQVTEPYNLVDRVLILLSKFRKYLELKRDANIEAMSLHLTNSEKVTLLVEAIDTRDILSVAETDSSASNDYNTDFPSNGQMNPGCLSVSSSNTKASLLHSLPCIGNNQVSWDCVRMK